MPVLANSSLKIAYTRLHLVLGLGLALSLTPGCASQRVNTELSAQTKAARADFIIQGSKQAGGGSAELVERSLTGRGLGATAEIALYLAVEGLRPGFHGVAISAERDCSSASEPKAHYDPRGGLHGELWDVVGHAGDLGNLEVASDGRATAWIQPLTAFRLEEVIGRALIIFEDRDDGVTQPDGGSGAAVLCGLIVAAPAGR